MKSPAGALRGGRPRALRGQARRARPVEAFVRARDPLGRLSGRAATLRGQAPQRLEAVDPVVVAVGPVDLERVGARRAGGRPPGTSAPSAAAPDPCRGCRGGPSRRGTSRMGSCAAASRAGSSPRARRPRRSRARCRRGGCPGEPESPSGGLYFSALGEEEVREDAVVGVRVGLPVRGDRGRRDVGDAGRIGRRELLPELALARGDVEPEDPGRIEAALVDVEWTDRRTSSRSASRPRAMPGIGVRLAAGRAGRDSAFGPARRRSRAGRRARRTGAARDSPAG